MKPFPLKQKGIPVSQQVLGCMGLGGGWNTNPITQENIREAHAAIDAALSIGINMFDHADIYTRGKAEQVFGAALKERPELRNQIYIQSKCGIRFGEEDGTPGRYDFSRTHIIRSVEGSLQRLGIDHLDFLLLHRPDPLMDPEEVAAAITELKTAGKVRWFGVSNMSAGQIGLLRAYSDEPFVVNQLEMSLQKIGWLETGVHVNQEAARANVLPEGTMEYCQLEGIQIQAWGPLAKGLYSGRLPEDASESQKNTAALVATLAEEKGTSREAIVLAWLMRHPAGIQPVIGTRHPDRIRNCGKADQIDLTREEWYRLYVSSRGVALP